MGLFGINSLSSQVNIIALSCSKYSKHYFHKEKYLFLEKASTWPPGSFPPEMVYAYGSLQTGSTPNRHISVSCGLVAKLLTGHYSLVPNPLPKQGLKRDKLVQKKLHLYLLANSSSHFTKLLDPWALYSSSYSTSFAVFFFHNKSITNLHVVFFVYKKCDQRSPTKFIYFRKLFYFFLSLLVFSSTFLSLADFLQPDLVNAEVPKAFLFMCRSPGGSSASLNSTYGEETENILYCITQ